MLCLIGSFGKAIMIVDGTVIAKFLEGEANRARNVTGMEE